MTFTCAAALLAGLALASSAAETPPLGANSPRNVTAADYAFLEKSLSTSKAYKGDVVSRICFTDVVKLEKQVMSGTRYKFQVRGCPVTSFVELGVCRDGNCEASVYDVVIFSQPWTSTLDVTSITKVS